MGAFPEDVEHFIERRFDEDDVAVAREWLEISELTTPRVIRSVLYLSDGSMYLLRRYIDQCIESVTGVLVEAEYVSDVSDEPLLARDMSLPFQHRRNLGRSCFGEPPAPSKPVSSRLSGVESDGGAARFKQQGGYHLSGQRFYLGEAMYVVARHQPSPDLVCCHRVHGNTMTPVRLPLMFVLERFAEPIELVAGP